MLETPHKSWGTIAVQLCLVLVVLVISVAGNGAVAALLVRFKKLRTIPNILIANMAVVDLLNTIINIPIFIIHSMLKLPGVLSPKTTACVIGFLYAIFYQLNIYSMVLLVLDRYGAIAHGMKYLLWKTSKKAYVAVALVWILALLYTAAAYIRFAEINIQNGTTDDYRVAQFQKTGRILALQALLPVVAIGISSALTWRRMSRANRLVSDLKDMAATVRQTREQNELKAAKTMLLTVVVYILSYLPTVTFAILVSKGLETDDNWHGFLASFGLFVSSGCNPIIYAARNKRFRHAFKQFWKDPCGKTPFQETFMMKEERKARQNVIQQAPTATFSNHPALIYNHSQFAPRLGSISAALSSPVFVPPREEPMPFGEEHGLTFPRQRLVIEPTPRSVWEEETEKVQDVSETMKLETTKG